jgi:drug/metabolite transporter (DMT)-like permease
MVTFLICSLVAALFVAANLSVMQSVKSERVWFWMLVTSALAVCAFWAHRAIIIKFGAMRATGIVDSLLTVFTLLVAWFLFQEKLTNLQWTGIGFMLVGLYLVK